MDVDVRKEAVLLFATTFASSLDSSLPSSSGGDVVAASSRLRQGAEARVALALFFQDTLASLAWLDERRSARVEGVLRNSLEGKLNSLSLQNRRKGLVEAFAKDCSYRALLYLEHWPLLVLGHEPHLLVQWVLMDGGITGRPTNLSGCFGPGLPKKVHWLPSQDADELSVFVDTLLAPGRT